MLQLWLVGNRTSCGPIRSVTTILVILLRRRPIMLISSVITDRIGLHSVLLPLSTKIFMSGAKANSEYVKEVTWSPNTHLSPVTGSTLLKVSLSRIVSVGTSINTTLEHSTTLMSNHINVLIRASVRLANFTAKPRFEIFNLKKFDNNEFPGQVNEKEYPGTNSANAKEKN